MRPRFEFLAIAAIGLAGCGKGGDAISNNSVGETKAPSANNVASNIAPDANSSANNAASNSAPDSNNSPAANNAPATNSPTAGNSASSQKVERTDGKPKPMNAILASQTGGWSKDAQAARDLASNVDESTKKLTNSKIHFYEAGRLSGGQGYCQGDLIIADQKRFLLNYGRYMSKGRAHFETYIVVQKPDGTYSTLVDGKYVAGRIAPDANVLDGWFTDSTHYLASSVGTDRKPLTELVDAAQKAKWKISVETKAFDNGTFKRIVMDSTTGTKRRYELTIEPKKMLLTNFNADVNGNLRNQVSVSFETLKSDKPLAQNDLKPYVPTEKINVLTPEEARKKGIKVPETPKPGAPPKN